MNGLTAEMTCLLCGAPLEPPDDLAAVTVRRASVNVRCSSCAVMHTVVVTLRVAT